MAHKIQGQRSKHNDKRRTQTGPTAGGQHNDDRRQTNKEYELKVSQE
jgi:hypothetical protein